MAHGFETAGLKAARSEALNALSKGSGFVLIEGPSGSGKSRLKNQLQSILKRHYLAVSLPYSRFQYAELLTALAELLQLNFKKGELLSCFNALHQFALAKQQAGTPLVLLIDDAELMPEETLVALARALSGPEHQRLAIRGILFTKRGFYRQLQLKHLDGLLVSQRLLLAPATEIEMLAFIDAVLEQRSGGAVGIDDLARQALIVQAAGSLRLAKQLIRLAVLDAEAAGSATITEAVIDRVLANECFDADTLRTAPPGTDTPGIDSQLQSLPDSDTNGRPLTSPAVGDSTEQTIETSTTGEAIGKQRRQFNQDVISASRKLSSDLEGILTAPLNQTPARPQLKRAHSINEQPLFVNDLAAAEVSSAAALERSPSTSGSRPAGPQAPAASALRKTNPADQGRAPAAAAAAPVAPSTQTGDVAKPGVAQAPAAVATALPSAALSSESSPSPSPSPSIGSPPSPTISAEPEPELVADLSAKLDQNPTSDRWLPRPLTLLLVLSLALAGLLLLGKQLGLTPERLLQQLETAMSTDQPALDPTSTAAINSASAAAANQNDADNAATDQRAGVMAENAGAADAGAQTVATNAATASREDDAELSAASTASKTSIKHTTSINSTVSINSTTPITAPATTSTLTDPATAGTTPVVVVSQLRDQAGSLDALRQQRELEPPQRNPAAKLSVEDAATLSQDSDRPPLPATVALSTATTATPVEPGDSPQGMTVIAAKAEPISADQQLEQATRAALDAKIRLLLKKADIHRKAFRFTIPEDDNAVLAYRNVLQLDADNRTAREGITWISGRYHYRASKAMEEQDWGLAAQNYSRLLYIDPLDQRAQAGVSRLQSLLNDGSLAEQDRP